MMELFLSVCCLIGLYNLFKARSNDYTPEELEQLRRECEDVDRERE